MAAGEIQGQIGQGYLSKTIQQQRLGLGHGLSECGIDRLFYKTGGGLMAVAQSMDRGPPKRVMQGTQGDGFQIGRDAPAPGMSAFRAHKARIPQKAHGAAHHDRVRAKALPQSFGRYRTFMLCHMQQSMKDTGEAAVTNHVTIDVTK